MNNPSFSLRPAELEPRADLARLIRRICVLREQGDVAGAARLEENQLATAVRDCRLAQGPDALPEGELQAMLATEERRVAEAAIMAELLAPRLAGAWPAASGPAVAVSPRTATFSPPSARANAPPGSPAIPDLLDAMLAAERNSRRLPATVKPES